MKQPLKEMLKAIGGGHLLTENADVDDYSHELGEAESNDENPTVKVQPDFELIAFDFVSNPSTQGAFLSPMREGVEHNSQIRKVTKVERIINDILRGE